ncbi:hypothetical protein pb186bvf_010444 [Paramecium bursaria]
MSSGGGEEEMDEDVQIEEEEEENAPLQNKPIVKKMVVDNTDPHNGTFVFTDEDHTLGNSLRFILSNHPEIDFIGYSLPHPSDNKMNVRVQTKEETKEKVMNDGLKTLEQIFQISVG